MNVAPLFEIVWLRRRVFLSIFGLTFLALFIAIFTVPKQLIIVRSDVNVGSRLADNRRQPIEPLDEVAKRASQLYIPSAIAALQRKDISSTVLDALRNSVIDGIANWVVLSSTVEAAAEGAAKEFQQLVANDIIMEAMPLAQAALSELQQAQASDDRTAKNLSNQIESYNKQIENLNGLIDDLRNQIENHRAELTKTYQSMASKQASELAEAETKVRELREQISVLSKLIADAMPERSHLIGEVATTRREHEKLAISIAKAGIEEQMFTRPYASAPSVLPTSTTSRQLRLAMLALVISFLVAFGSVVLLHNSFNHKYLR